MNTFSFLVVLLCALASVRAFSPGVRRQTSIASSPKTFYPFSSSSSSLKMSEEPEEPEFVAPEPQFFDGNKRVRLGRSKDQDGKSNIWSIEPKMEVMEGEDESGKSNLFILGGVLAAVAAAIPIFLTLTKLLPDPSDY